jgi:hypothetical protein
MAKLKEACDQDALKEVRRIVEDFPSLRTAVEATVKRRDHEALSNLASLCLHTLRRVYEAVNRKASFKHERR